MMNEITHVLIVDDDARDRSRLRSKLERHGYLVDEATNGTSAIRYLKQHLPDLDMVILDLVMPDIDGLDICMWMRAQSDVPIVVIGDVSEEHLVIRALHAGADDYIARPFSVPLLEARLEAVLRRANHGSLVQEESKIEIEDMVIDLEARRVFVNDIDLKLTHTEFALISEVASHLDNIVRHETLLSRVWGPEYQNESHYLYIYFGRVRDKLGKKYSQLIETVSGMGYIMHSSLDNGSS